MSSLSNIPLSPQEIKIISHLSDKKEEYFQNLAQFTKNPQTIKLKSVQKIISDIKKKFKKAEQPLPFNCQLKSMATILEKPKMVQTDQSVVFNGQVLTKILRSFTNNNLSEQPINTIPVQENKSIRREVEIKVHKYNRLVQTGSGNHTLNIEDFEVFEYLYLHCNKVISLEELRDQVVYPKWGSKLPARWFSSILRRVNNIRRNIPELKDKLLTVKLDNSTGYIFRN